MATNVFISLLFLFFFVFTDTASFIRLTRAKSNKTVIHIHTNNPIRRWSTSLGSSIPGPRWSWNRGGGNSGSGGGNGRRNNGGNGGGSSFIPDTSRSWNSGGGNNGGVGNSRGNDGDGNRWGHQSSWGVGGVNGNGGGEAKMGGGNYGGGMAGDVGGGGIGVGGIGVGGGGIGVGAGMGAGSSLSGGIGGGNGVSGSTGMGSGNPVTRGGGVGMPGGGMSIGENGFPNGQQFSLKFGNGRCIYPEDGQAAPGTKLMLPEEVCFSEKAKFFISERGNLKHVETDFCVQPEDELLDYYSPIVIDEACDKRWTFIMTSGGSLKLAGSGQCIQPSSGSTEPSLLESLVFRENCDEPKSKFQIEDTKPYSEDGGIFCVGNGGMEDGCRAGFPIGIEFSLKFENGRCLYPENHQISLGTKLVAPSDVCRTDLAKFIISDVGNLKHVKTGFCVQPEEDDDDVPLVLSKGCGRRWAFTMTVNGSLKVEDGGKCVQPGTGSTRPSETEYFVLRDICDVPETQFTIFKDAIRCEGTGGYMGAGGREKGGRFGGGGIGCESALGMENGKIQDSQITSSTAWKGLPPQQGRLNSATSWSTGQINENQWIQIDLGKQAVITRIATQGRKNYDQWVKSYILSYSFDGESFQSYKVDGTTKVFNGNSDRNSVVTNELLPSISTRYIRIHPQSWYGYISMRIEIYGCYREITHY